MSDIQQQMTKNMRTLLGRIVTDLTAVRTRIHASLIAHQKQQTQQTQLAALIAETEHLKQQRGIDNEMFREELIHFILDYNTIIKTDPDTLYAQLSVWGLNIPDGVDRVLLQTHVANLLETAAVHVSDLPANPLNMIDDLTALLRDAPPQMFEVEAVLAHQVIHILLSGEKTAAAA